MRKVSVFLFFVSSSCCCMFSFGASISNKNITANATYNERVSISGNVTISDGVTLTVNGNNLQMMSNSSLTIQGTGKLVVNGDIRCYDNAPCVIKGDGGGTVDVSGSIWSTKGYSNAIITIKDLQIENDLQIGINNSATGGTVRLENVTVSNDMIVYGGSTYTVVEIPSSSRVSVGNDLTMYNSTSQMNVNGRFVVGSGSYIDGKYIIDPASGTGTITNKGTINIETPTNKRTAAKTNPDLYAAVTARDIISNGYIYEDEGFLIAQNDMTFSKGVYFQSGHSYVDVWHDMYQQKGAAIGSTGAGATSTIMVGNTYNDATTFDWTSVERTLTGYTFYLPHLWYFERVIDTRGKYYGTDGAFEIDPSVELIVDSYVLNGTNQSSLVHSNDVSFLKDQKAQAQTWIKDADNNIAEANKAIQDLTAPNGSEYKRLIKAYTGSWTEEQIEDYINGLIAEQQEIIKENTDNKNLWNEQIQYSDILIGYISSYDDQKGSTFKSWKQKFDDWFTHSHYSSSGSNVAWGQIKKASGIRNLLLEYIKQYGINMGEYEDVAQKISDLLPIELSYFDISQEGYSISFEWMTESEHNNDYFTVEYSLDGIQFYTIEMVDGAGTSSEQHWYNTSTEAEQFDGFVYFRLKQTDFNGVFSYSEVKALNVQSSGSNFTIYPNPASKYITIDGGAYTSVYFVDMQSRTYSAVQMEDNMFSVENLSSGLYFAVISTAKGTVVKEFVVSSNSDWED